MLSANLPDDVVEEIAVRLPVKSLLRFKCIAKSWYSLITQPSFITKHLEWSNSITEKRGLRLISRVHNVARTARMSLISKDEPNSVSHNLELPFPDQDDLGMVFVCGQCDGIFCLFGPYGRDNPGSLYHETHLILWNPATKEVKVLPVPNLRLKSLACVMFGFGIDPITKDYKVVRFWNFHPCVERHPPVDVYNLSTDSWRTIDALVPAFQSYIPKWRTYLNGFYHWITDDNINDTNKRAILCFDFSKEVFRKIHLPIDYAFDQRVAVIDESLACIATYLKSNYELKVALQPRFEIWVMNEYGVESSWSKKYVIGPHLEVMSILGFWGDHEILGELENEEEGRLVSYNRRNQQVQRFQIVGVQGLICMSSYVESLVPLA